MGRCGQTQTSFVSSSVSKRAGSAKGPRKERKVVYEHVQSKKSLKQEEYGGSNREDEDML